MRARLFLALALVGGIAEAAAPAAHPFTVEDLLHLGRLGGWDVSRDGRRVIFAVTRADVDENKTTSALWLQDGNGPAQKVTAGTKKDKDPRLSPDGKSVVFVSDRDGTPQLYRLELG